MSELSEFRREMQRPESFHLELPPGHPGLRPFSALLAALEVVRRDSEAIVADLERVRAGEALNVDEVGVLFSKIDQLGQALAHGITCANPIYRGLKSQLTPPPDEKDTTR